MHETRHHLFQLFFTHLSVADAYSRFRRELLNEIRERINGFNTIVDDVYLPATFQLEIDGVLDDDGFELRDDGLDGQTVSRRSFDHRHVAHTAERHIQCARNWRG